MYRDILGSINFMTSATCVIKSQAKFMDRIDHVKITKTTMDLSTSSTQLFVHFPVHIQYFYNLPQTKCSPPRSLQHFINSKIPLEPEIILSDSLEVSLISHTTTNIIIQNNKLIN